MSFVQILKYKITTDICDLAIDNSISIVNTINPHCYCEAKKDDLYREALQKSDILIPDGIGIVWAVRIIKGQKIKRIAGADLHKHLLERTNERNGRVFYLGTADSTLNRIEKRVKHEYPNILVSSYSPPYKPEFSYEENTQMISAINAFNPDVLFVGMTAPKQEKWAYKHKDLLDVKIIASIGAVFDFYAGTIKRPNIFWQKLGLEWLFRFLREPRRLWKRNFISTPKFLWDVLNTKYIQNKN